MRERILLTVCICVAVPFNAFATWSVIDLDTETGQVIVASATLRATRTVSEPAGA